MLAERDSSPGRRPAQFSKPKIRNTVAECVQYARGGNDWIVTEVMSPDGRWRTTAENADVAWGLLRAPFVSFVVSF
jgi:hypothetical protein